MSRAGRNSTCVISFSESPSALTCLEQTFYTLVGSKRTMLSGPLFGSPAGDLQPAISDGALPYGLIYLPDFISKAEERAVVMLLDDPNQAKWSHELSRRVQHFGYRYDYKLRALTSADKIADPPEFIRALGQRLVDLEYFITPPDQVIVNEYEPGQGISPHIDRETCFGPAVASLSIGSEIVMDFRSQSGKAGSLLLRPRSLVVLSEDSRFRWKHSIAARKRDVMLGQEYLRSRRISLTFRTVLMSEAPFQ